jgi:hypothetical protein
MLDINNNLTSRLLDEHSKKIFIVKINFPNNIRYYSTDSFVIHDTTFGNIFIKGSIENDIVYKESFDYINNSVSISSISIDFFDDELDLFELSKTYELNLIEASVYFGTNDLLLDDFIQLFNGIIRINKIGLIGDLISLNIENVDNKFDKLFPPLKLSDQLVWTNLENEAEKYNGELVPIIYGSILEPGLPIPLYFDDGIVTKYAVANHNVSNLQVFADGELIPSFKYTDSYDASIGIYKIDPTFIITGQITLLRNGENLNSSYYTVTDLGGGDFRINVLPPPPVVVWEVEVDFGSGFELVPFDKAHLYFRAFDTYRLYVHIDTYDDPIKVYGNGEEVEPLQIKRDPVFPSGFQAEIRVRSVGIGDDVYKVLVGGEEIPDDFYDVTFEYNYNEYIVNVTGYNYFNEAFRGKKITASCDGLLASNPILPSVINDMLNRFSNLPISKIDTSNILSKIELNGFKVNRFFNSDSTLFETLDELSLNFPFIVTNRNDKKSINSVLLNTSAIFDLIENANLFDRDEQIKITGPQELYNVFSVRYDYNALDNRWNKFISKDRTNDAQCQTAYARISLDKELKTFDLYSVNDLVTANNILSYKIDLFTTFHYIMMYLCKHDVVTLELGDKILITDSEYDFVNKKFMVINKIINQDFTQLIVMST